MIIGGANLFGKFTLCLLSVVCFAIASVMANPSPKSDGAQVTFANGDMIKFPDSESQLASRPETDELLEYYLEEMRDDSYLWEKTENTIRRWAKPGKKYYPMAINVIASYAIYDYHAYLSTDGVVDVVVKMTEDIDFKRIKSALERCAEIVE